MRSIAKLVGPALALALPAGAHDIAIHNFTQATWILRAADLPTRTALTDRDQVSTLEVPGGASLRVTLPGDGTFTFRLIDARAQSGLTVAWTLQAQGDEGPEVRPEVQTDDATIRPEALVRMRADSLALLAEAYGAQGDGEGSGAVPAATFPAGNAPVPEGAFALPSGESSPEPAPTASERVIRRRSRARRARDLAHPYLTPNEATAMLEALGQLPSGDNVERKAPDNGS
ncbi:MAG TPA: hypothetical protein VK188_15920 [Holophaga sp.]|nr:hypothetical protein [Holophaga sp.]